MTNEERLLSTGDFRVHTDGTIWRVRTRGRLHVGIRAEHRTPGGYLQLRRMIDGKRIYSGAHRVVWTDQHGPIPDGMEVNHRNGIKDDNRPQNLELASPGENLSHAHQSGLVDQSGERNPSSKLSDRAVAQIRLAYAQGGHTQADLALRFGVAHQTISRIVRGQRRPKQGGPVSSKDHRRSGGGR